MKTPDLEAMMCTERSPLQDVLVWFHSDSRALGRRWPIPVSPSRHREFGAFLDAWQEALEGVDYDALNLPGQVDWHLLRLQIAGTRLHCDHDRREFEDAREWLPFAGTVLALEEGRLAIERMDARRAAEMLNAAANDTKALTPA